MKVMFLRAMSMKALLLWPMLLLLTPVAAQVTNINSYYDGFIAPLRKKGLPVFVTSCRVEHGKGILFFVLGDKEGRYVEFADNGLQANGAAVSLTDPVKLNDVMGGIWTIQNEEGIIQSLIRSKFTLVSSGQLENVLKVTPSFKCSSM